MNTFGLTTIARNSAEGHMLGKVLKEAWYLDRRERATIADIPAIKAAYSVYRHGICVRSTLVLICQLLRDLKDGEVRHIAVHTWYEPEHKQAVGGYKYGEPEFWAAGIRTTAVVVTDKASHAHEPHRGSCTLLTLTGGVED